LQRCVFALAWYITFESVLDLVQTKKPEYSLAGIILASLSLLVMPSLSRLKNRVEEELKSRTMHADAR
jgi:divalent metal cation (Fe/Co/Zn/Cd) transporter